MTSLPRPTRAWHAVSSRRRGIAVGVLAMVAGAVLGTVVAFLAPTHVEIAGSDTRVWVRPGRSYDELAVQGLVTLQRPTPRAVLGESFGIEAILDLNTAQLVDADGQFDPGILPAYIQAYSDPAELVADIRSALLLHLVVFAAVGATSGALLAGAGYRYRRWRAAYEARYWPREADRRAAAAYRAPEAAFTRRVAIGVLIAAVLAVVPSGGHSGSGAPHIRADDLFNGTPLEGTRVEGLLRPALRAAQGYIRTYFGDTNAYYTRLEAKLNAQLALAPVDLPTGDDLAQLGFVTDRHCNTGMDRVVVSLLERYGVHTLASAGDDAFSGSFGFEAACTRNLAERTHRAGITDVFVGGNHDSPQTLGFERKQKIKTLTGQVVKADGLQFIGTPDPRTSRYGQGIRPAPIAAQHALVDAQGAAVGRTACATKEPLIALLHDPRAGAAAIDHGCGQVRLALDGHTHVQKGPIEHVLPNDATATAFTGATSGGAPGGGSTDRSLASSITVGPLNHVATVYILTVERTTGRLVAITDFRFTPDQDITVGQQLVP